MARLRRIAVLLGVVAPMTCAANAPPAWLHVGTPLPVDQAQSAYYEFATARIDPKFDPSHVLRFDSPSSKFSGQEGELAGDWTFFARVGDTLPRSAWRLRVSSSTTYRVDAQLYCEGDECRRLADDLKAMPPPRPGSGAYSLTAWRKIVAEERCDPLPPPSRPKFVYPREELRRGIEGTVVVSVFHNKCGDVREATLATSSGNRNLDRAARAQLLRSRVKPTTPGKAGWKNETFEFRLDNPENPPPPKPIDVECICDPPEPANRKAR